MRVRSADVDPSSAFGGRRNPRQSWAIEPGMSEGGRFGQTRSDAGRSQEQGGITEVVAREYAGAGRARAA